MWCGLVRIWYLINICIRLELNSPGSSRQGEVGWFKRKKTKRKLGWLVRWSYIKTAWPIAAMATVVSCGVLGWWNVEILDGVPGKWKVESGTWKEAVGEAGDGG